MPNADSLDRLIDEGALPRYLETTLGPGDLLEIDDLRERLSTKPSLEWSECSRLPSSVRCSTAESVHDVLGESFEMASACETITGGPSRRTPIPRRMR